MFGRIRRLQRSRWGHSVCCFSSAQKARIPLGESEEGSGPEMVHKPPLASPGRAWQCLRGQPPPLGQCLAVPPRPIATSPGRAWPCQAVSPRPAALPACPPPLAVPGRASPALLGVSGMQRQPTKFLSIPAEVSGNSTGTAWVLSISFLGFRNFGGAPKLRNGTSPLIPLAECPKT